MSTYKRRIVYLSDEEWEQLGRVAKDRKITISATVRDLLPGSVQKLEAVIPVDAVLRSPWTPQAKRDELLRKINRSKSPECVQNG